MEILVSKILDNPWRNFERNPLIDSRTEQLMESIGETGFWDNVVVRPSETKGLYDLAYGHHRIEAVRQLGIETVDVPVKNLTDAIMVKMMADENLMQWGNSPAATNEAIEAARDLIEWSLQTSESAEDFSAYTGVRANFKPNDWARIKNDGEAGSHIIQQFLGSNSWNLNTIVGSLKVVNAERDAEKHAAAEQAAREEAAALEQVRRKKEAERKAEEAKAAQARAAQAKAKAEEADAKDAAARRKAAERAKAEKVKLDAANRAKEAARKAAKKSEADALKKRNEAVKAHAALNKVVNTPDRDSYERFATQRQATTFTNEVSKYTMTAAERERLTTYLVDHEVAARPMPTIVKDWVSRFTKAGKSKAVNAKKQKAFIKGTTLDDYVSDFNASVPDVVDMLKAIEPYIDNIDNPRVLKMFKKRISELAPVVNKVVTKINALETLKVI